MDINNLYTFNVSISKDAYKTKQQCTAAIMSGQDGRVLRKNAGLKDKLCFFNVTLTPGELLEKIIHGHTICTLHSGFPLNDKKRTYVKSDGSYTLSGKSDEFFAGSYFIGVDIDQTSYNSPVDFVDAIGLKPTFWYTSYSHSQTDDNGNYLGPRFRLMYIFDQIITDKYFFRYVAWKIHSMIEKDTKEIIEDKCGLKCSQYYNGTNIEDSSLVVEYNLSNVIYSFDDFKLSNEDFYYFIENNCFYNSPNKQIRTDIEEMKCLLFCKINNNTQHTINLSACKKSKRLSKEELSLDNNMICDAYRLDWEEFYSRYRHKYPYIYRTEKEKWTNITTSKLENIVFQYCEEGYIELQWLPNTLHDG